MHTIGDFSFAQSLAQHHKVKHITATCYDSEQVLHQKYPRVKDTLRRLASNGSMDPPKSRSEEQEAEWRGLSPSPSSSSSDSGAQDNLLSDLSDRSSNPHVRVNYCINATKLSTTHAKALRLQAPFTKVVFNFPHVGGLSTDVNRQVRANQELLVGFFKAALPLLASPQRPVRHDERDDEAYGDSDEMHDDDGLSNEEDIPSASKGQILVTLFEGEPYTLWNIRDLARHCGLKVVESFKFPWEAYPGYAHARTIGEITKGKDRSAEGRRKGAWRGEERQARCFVMEVKHEDENGAKSVDVGTGANTGPLGERNGMGKRKRKGGGSDSGSD